jgi:hypothetical protein
MSNRTIVNGQNQRRRAIVLVQVMVMLTALMGFAAFTVDIGTLYRARAELQASADAAAMAAASAYTTDSMLEVRVTDGDAVAFADVLYSADDRANVYAGLNNTLNMATLVETTDISAGWIDLTSATSLLDTLVLPMEYNAVQVTVRRDTSGRNGPVEFLFAPIIGHLVGETSASAVAVFNDQFSGFDVDGNGSAAALPISIHMDIFNDQFVNGPDVYEYLSDSESVATGPDGIPEINLYPFNVAPGNFGLLNIGSPNQGVPALQDQIENGVSSDDMESETGASELVFYDEDGSPITYDITGSPGLKTALEGTIADRIGDVVAFFLHEGTAQQGANAVYTISSVRFGRIMDIELNGPPAGRGLWIQPVSYNGGGVIISDSAPSSNGLVGRLVLAR